MKFDVYGRFQLEVLRENNVWVAYRPGPGTSARDSSIVIPESLAPQEIAGYLDDLFHELCGPGQIIRVVSQSQGQMDMLAQSLLNRRFESDAIRRAAPHGAPQPERQGAS